MIITRKNKKNSRSRRRINYNMNIRSYPGQALASHWTPCVPFTLSTTVTSGLLSQCIQVDPTALVQAWATRFQTLYEEYRVIAAKADLNFFSSVQPGVITCFWDEKTPFTAPTLASSIERAMRRCSLSSTDKPLRLSWKARDLLDLQYTPIATSNPSVGLSIYTDNANYGSGIVAAAVVTVNFRLHIQFRGYTTV
jgi:hypothetical protein